MDEVFVLLGKVVAAVGGAGIIIVALSGFLSKLWAQWFMERQKKQYSKEIEEYKNNLLTELEKCKMFSEEMLYRKKSIFDNEFEIYKEIVPQMIRASKSVLDYLCIIKLTVEITETFEGIFQEKSIEEKYGIAFKDVYDFWDVIIKYAVFIEEDNYVKLCEFFNQCNEMLKLKEYIDSYEQYDWDLLIDKQINEENRISNFLRNKLRRL